MNLKLIFSLCLFIWSINGVVGQESISKHPVFSISFFNHSIGIPFRDYLKTPLNIGVTLGVEFSYDRDENINEAGPRQRIELGWYSHRNLNTAIWIKSDFISGFQSENEIFVDLHGGLGYIVAFNKQETFRKTINGKYESAGGAPKAGLLIGVGFAGGYRFQNNDEFVLSPFLRYDGMIQYPYGKLLPIFPHSLLHVGTKYRMK